MDRRDFLRISPGLALAGIAEQRAAAAEDFEVHDVVVSNPNQSLIDPEFSPSGRRMAWVDRDHQIWLNGVNRYGRWFPSNGKELLIDTDLEQVGAIRQGAEWAYGQGGPRLLYTKVINSARRMFQARFVDGEWIPDKMPRSKNRAVLRGSHDRGDRRPRVLYHRIRKSGRLVFGWREIDDPETDEIIPLIDANNLIRVRWATGERSVVVPDSALGQVLKYDIDTGELTCLTDDAFTKRFPVMYRDELGAFLTVVLDDQWIGVYYEDGGDWPLVQMLRPPSVFPYVFDPKLWFHAGIPYLSFMMTTELDGRMQNTQGDSEVWIAEVTAGDPFYRRVNDPQITRIKDTEGVSLLSGAYVYYTQILPDRRRIIHRCDTGLGVSEW